RRPGQRDPPRRARLLDAAPPPEGGGGGAGAGYHPGATRGDRPDLRRGLPAHRLPRRRHVRVPVRERPLLFHRDEHPHPGGAPGHRDGHRHRPGARAAEDRRRGEADDPAGGRGAARPRHRVPDQRRGPGHLPALAGTDPAFPYPRRTGRARGLAHLRGLRGAAELRLDDRQADRARRRPRRGDRAHARGAVRDGGGRDQDQHPAAAADHGRRRIPGRRPEHPLPREAAGRAPREVALDRLTQNPSSRAGAVAGAFMLPAPAPSGAGCWVPGTGFMPVREAGSTTTTYSLDPSGQTTLTVLPGGSDMNGTPLRARYTAASCEAPRLRISSSAWIVTVETPDKPSSPPSAASRITTPIAATEYAVNSSSQNSALNLRNLKPNFIDLLRYPPPARRPVS